MVVEHHGGMKRFGRMSGSVRLPTWTARLLMVVAVVTIWMTAIGQVAAAAFAGGTLLIVLVATILEACRLEAAITLAADSIARELDAESA
jgi:Flp pilus assembly protein TadB